MRKVILLLMILGVCNVYAERKKVGLVLGGGGAKGAAHVGVLKVLEEAQIPIDYIAGTSAGALIGGLYAAGYSADQLDSLIHHLDWKSLMSDQSSQKNLFYKTKERDAKYLLTFPFNKKISLPAGIVSGQNVMNLLSDMTIGYHDLKSFEDLPIPFACVATDLSGGKSMVLSSGSLPLAMRASMSIPGYFTPVSMDSMILVDGGVLNNLPTNVVKAMGADITIGVDLSAGEGKQDLYSFMGMLNQLIDIMGSTMYEKNKADLDLCLVPALKGYGTMSFFNQAIDTLYNSGLQTAQAHLPQLLALKAEIYGGDTTNLPPYREFDNTAAMHLYDTIRINDIFFENIPPQDYRWFLKETELKQHSNITLKDINNALSILEGLDMFSSVTYTLSDKEPCDLIFILKKKALNQINVGFRFDTESLGSLLLNTTFSQKFLKGGEVGVTAKLDMNPYLEIDYNWGAGFMNKLSVGYKLGYHNFNMDKHRKRIDNIYFFWQNANLKYMGVFKNLEVQTGLEWDYYGRINAIFDTDYNPMKVNRGSYVNYFCNLNIDAYDNKYYPHKGFYGSFSAKLITDNFIGINGNSPLGVIAFNVETVVSFTDGFSLIPSLSGRFLWGDEVPAIYQNYMGGSLNARYLPQQIAFPGIRNIQVFEDMLGMARLMLRFRLKPKHYIFAGGDFAKQSQHIGDIFSGDNIWSTHARYSFDSPVGPISLQLSYSNWVKQLVAYASIGYNF